MRNFLGFLIVGVLCFSSMSCETKEASPSSTDSSSTGFVLPKNYETQTMGPDLEYAFLENDGKTQVEGFLRNGQKDGVWITYYSDRRKIERVEHFYQGELHGIKREFSLNGNMTLAAKYSNGQLHGEYEEYKFGYPLKKANYVEGNLDGEVLLYFEDKDNYGTLQQKMEYKNGKKHGVHQYFNDKEEVVLEYRYKNGERLE